MAEKLEYFDSGGNTTPAVYIDRWYCQTFTPQVNATLGYCRVYINKSGTPTDSLTLAIKATDGEGKPTGPNLTEITLPHTSIGTSLAWITFNFPDIDIENGTKYALILSTGAAFLGYGWRGNTAGGYPRGECWQSQNQGSSWLSQVMEVFFEAWGTEIKAPGGGAMAASLLQGAFI